MARSLISSLLLGLALASLLRAGQQQEAGPRDLAELRDELKIDGVWRRPDQLVAHRAGHRPFDLELLGPSRWALSRRGLFPCGRFWFDEADANDYHSRIGRWWRMPGRHFRIYATTDRAVNLRALQEADRTWETLQSIFGRAPEIPPTVILLRSLAQYNAFGVTRPTKTAVAPEVSGFSGFHYAFPCESWVDLERDRDYPGAAAAYWDASRPHGDEWGLLAVRHAAAQAFIESIDPSPKVVGRLRRRPGAPFDARAFWAEKRLPLWFRYGVAVYLERFLRDEEHEDPRWLSSWSRGEIRATGGLGDLEVLFAASFEVKTPGRSAALILRMGYLVEYLFHEGRETHAVEWRRLQEAIRRGRGEAKAFARLVESLRKDEDLVDLVAPPER